MSTDGSFTFQSFDPVTNQLLAAAVDVLLSAVLNPANPPTPLAKLPQYNYSLMDKWLRQKSLPQRLSKEGLEVIGLFLPLADNWQCLLDLVPTLPNRSDKLAVVGAVAYIEVWLRFNPPPLSSTATSGG